MWKGEERGDAGRTVRLPSAKEVHKKAAVPPLIRVFPGKEEDETCLTVGRAWFQARGKEGKNMDSKTHSYEMVHIQWVTPPSSPSPHYLSSHFGSRQPRPREAVPAVSNLSFKRWEGGTRHLPPVALGSAKFVHEKLPESYLRPSESHATLLMQNMHLTAAVQIRQGKQNWLSVCVCKHEVRPKGDRRMLHHPSISQDLEASKLMLGLSSARRTVFR